MFENLELDSSVLCLKIKLKFMTFETGFDDSDDLDYHSVLI